MTSWHQPAHKNLGRCQGTWSDFHGYADPIEAVKGADLVVLALPVRATQKVLETIKPYLSENVILTDVGSTKGNVVEAAKAVFGENLPAGFVPGHPIAGAEHTGVHAGKVDLLPITR